MTFILILLSSALLLIYVIWVDIEYFNGNAPFHIMTLAVVGVLCGMGMAKFFPVEEIRTKEKVSVTYEITLNKNNNKTDTTYIYTFKDDNTYTIGNLNLNTDLLKH